MMQDDHVDDTRPVRIVAGLALLVLLGAWLATALEEPARQGAKQDAAGTAQAERSIDLPRRPPAVQQGASEPESQTLRQAAADTPATQAAVRAAERAQEQQGGDKTVSPQIGRALSKVIELLNADKYAEATAALESLLTSEALSTMTPFERSRAYQLSFNLNYMEGNYEAAQADLQAAIESGGLNAEEMKQMQYQRAQLFVQMEDYAKAADSLELWIAEHRATPNQGAYYLLATSYYQQEKFDDARDHLETLFSMPGEKHESWYSMLSSLYIQDKAYDKAIPLLESMVDLYDKDTYRKQLDALREITAQTR